jgi:hypothetical protein
MSERQLAAYWGISARTLQLWRIEGRRPDYVKFGRCVRYPLRAAAAFELIHLVKRRSIHPSEVSSSKCPAPPIELELTPEPEVVLVRMRGFLNRTRAVTMRS